MHRMQLVQVAHSELIETLLRLFLNQNLKVLFCILSLFDLCLQYFFELVNFIECFGIALLMTLSLLLRFLLDLLFNCDIVILKTTQGRLQLYWTLLSVSDCWWDQHARVCCRVESIKLIITIWNCCRSRCIYHVVTAWSSRDYAWSLLLSHCLLAGRWAVLQIWISLIAGAWEDFARAATCRNCRRFCLFKLCTWLQSCPLLLILLFDHWM